jgi:hypothetical protein
MKPRVASLAEVQYQQKQQAEKEEVNNMDVIQKWIP